MERDPFCCGSIKARKVSPKRGISSHLLKNDSDCFQQRKKDGVCPTPGVNPKFGGKNEGDEVQEHCVSLFKYIVYM